MSTPRRFILGYYNKSYRDVFWIDYKGNRRLNIEVAHPLSRLQMEYQMDRLCTLIGLATISHFVIREVHSEVDNV